MQTELLSGSQPKSLPAQIPTSIKETLERLEHVLEQLTHRRMAKAPASAWDRFLALPEGQQTMIEAAWTTQTAFVEAALRASTAPGDGRALLALALDRLSAPLEPALLARIGDQDSVELRNWEGGTLYRSPAHFSFGRYSLVELDAIPARELYGRSGVDADLCLTEKLTEEKLAFEVREKFRARLAGAALGEPLTLLVLESKPRIN